MTVHDGRKNGQHGEPMRRHRGRTFSIAPRTSTDMISELLSGTLPGLVLLLSLAGLVAVGVAVAALAAHRARLRERRAERERQRAI
jgi:hypothetical protein